jgi:hypothetical protein
MLGQANIDADPGFIVRVIRKTGTAYGLMGAVNTKASGSGSPFILFFSSIFRFRKAAYSGGCLAKVSEVDLSDFTFSQQKLCPEVAKIVGVRRSQADTCNDYSLL